MPASPNSPSVCAPAPSTDGWATSWGVIPSGTVCELGVGLGTRFDRLGNNLATSYYDVLCDTFPAQRQYFVHLPAVVSCQLDAEVANAISPARTGMSPIVQVSTLAPGALVAQNLLDGTQV
jgi:hypothetical protein